MYPVMLEVRDRPCLVVGGGGVALRKVNGLRAEGAKVTVVARVPSTTLVELAREEAIVLEHRAYEPGEAAAYSLVIAATDDRKVNRRVFEDSEAAGVWCNVADDPELCSFHLPARVQRGRMQLAVASGGDAPFVVRRLRQLLERHFGEEWSEWIEAAARFREEVRRRDLPRQEAERRFDAFFDETVDPVRLHARVPSAEEERAYLAGEMPGGIEEGAATAEPEPAPATPGVEPGLVSLVGAGPGDPGLLTLRGYERCQAADAIVYDRLAAPALPCDLPPDVELHAVGKQASRHPVPQEEINALLVRLSREGKQVVRLKGGDPFVFGRGSEEAGELARAGLPFEIVPSVTAGIAVPAYAGIPVTHRREAVRVTIVTAHEAVKSDGPQVRWDLLGADPHATILGYMGVTQLPGVMKQLLGSGLDPKTPAAMIERGTTSAQRVVKSTAAELPAAVEEAGLRPPGLFVIGPTVAHADELDWFGRSPLQGQRLVLAAPRGEVAAALELAGAQVLGVPLPLTPAARVVVDALPVTGCVVWDAAEVDELDEERDGPSWSADAPIWCLGEAPAARARELGWRVVRELSAGVLPAEVVNAIAAAR
jgi:uroporphyrin-III C-methyltransferase/precorrin-2 dehydrogenase/sirohydrochlorin ferrochelatase